MPDRKSQFIQYDSFNFAPQSVWVNTDSLKPSGY